MSSETLSKSFEFQLLRGYADPSMFETSTWDISDEDAADWIGSEDCDFSITNDMRIIISSIPNHTFWCSETNEKGEIILVSNEDETLWVKPYHTKSFESWFEML
jgi:hypothetical protein